MKGKPISQRVSRARAGLAAWPSAAVWLLLGTSTLAFYWAAFVLPFNLLQWWSVPALSIGKLTHWQLATGLRYLVVYATLFGLYWLAYRHARQHATRLDWLLALACLALFNFTLLWVYPIEASDVFDNIMRGRMFAWYGANPFYRTPVEFQFDAVYPYIAWRYVGSAYGPLWEQMAGGLVRLAGADLLTTVLVFKAASVAGYAATLALITVAVRRVAPERALAGVVLYGWCPLVLYTTAGSAHNDALMLPPLILGCYLLWRHRYAATIWALVVGALIKFIPLVLAPLVCVAAWRRLGDGTPAAERPAPGLRAALAALPGVLRGTARWRFALLAAGGALLLGGLAFAPFWQGGDVLGLERRSELLTTSAPALVHVLLMRFASLAKEASAALVSRGALVVLALAMLFALRAAARRGHYAPFRAGRDLLLFYLLVACLWVQPWYVGWPLALSALLPLDRGARATVLLAFTMMCKALFFEYVLMPYEKGALYAVRELWLAPVLLGPVWLYLAWGLVRRLRRGRARGRSQASAQVSHA